MGELQLIVLAGLPLAGKSTLARALEKKLRIPRIDNDEVRYMLFRHHLADSERDRTLDDAQMHASWKSLMTLTDNALETGESVIAVGTFSREINHQRIKEIAASRQAVLKVIFCHATDEVVAQRLKKRKIGGQNFSNAVSMEAYLRVKARYQKINAPNLLEVDTTNSIKRCLRQIIDFVKE